MSGKILLQVVRKGQLPDTNNKVNHNSYKSFFDT
ncbi:hypothetical protein QE404_003455 [Chryseobacterium camelliae]|uniref:Uncharacterized protein n=1 Tax=Chryseobacterium camelliae TaxID=1265445 RepID=A0ABU0TMN9_9FLAO|nr:hypothetical protein [Chryseobacterium camelliae]